MTKITIQLPDSDCKRLEKTAKSSGKSIDNLIHELVMKLPDSDEPFDVTKDPIYLMEGYDSDAPPDLASNLDKYLYGDEYPT